MSDLLTVDELIQRIREQNGAVIDPTDMDWILVTRRLYLRAVFASDIPKIMDSMRDARMITNTDMKPVQPQISECKSQDNVEPAAVECESQDNVIKECRSRAAVIADYVGAAIMAKVFDVQHEMGRQELYSEQVMENGI